MPASTILHDPGLRDSMVSSSFSPDPARSLPRLHLRGISSRDAEFIKSCQAVNLHFFLATLKGTKEEAVP